MTHIKVYKYSFYTRTCKCVKDKLEVSPPVLSTHIKHNHLLSGCGTKLNFTELLLFFLMLVIIAMFFNRNVILDVSLKFLLQQILFNSMFR